jgi:hypothetical protein
VKRLHRMADQKIAEGHRAEHWLSENLTQLLRHASK